MRSVSSRPWRTQRGRLTFSGQGEESALVQGANILVVDDEESVRVLVQRVLERAGHRVQTAANGLEALKVIDVARPDLVISDITMPELDGLTLVEGLRFNDATRAMPVIFLTASESSAHFAKSVELRARHYLTKPFNAEKLLDKVRQVLARA